MFQTTNQISDFCFPKGKKVNNVSKNAKTPQDSQHKRTISAISNGV